MTMRYAIIAALTVGSFLPIAAESAQSSYVTHGTVRHHRRAVRRNHAKRNSALRIGGGAAAGAGIGALAGGGKGAAIGAIAGGGAGTVYDQHERHKGR